MAEVTLGGDRLGAGKGMTQDLHNYGMNSFNQGRDWKSTMAPGVLYPCFKEIGTNFGTFDIDIDAFVRTLPTKGPLFGSFKMQVDFFNVPFRLYQGILHNNPVDIGLNMNKVYLPVIEIGTKDGATAPRVKGSTDNDYQINPSSLEKYLGLSGIGRQINYETENTYVQRQIQCVPELGYYDIFKNYYSNKQEEEAYVIIPDEIRSEAKQLITEYQNYNAFVGGLWIKGSVGESYTIIDPNLPHDESDLYGALVVERIRFKGQNININNIYIDIWGKKRDSTNIDIDENLAYWLNLQTEDGGPVNWEILKSTDGWWEISFSPYFLYEICGIDYEQKIQFTVYIHQKNLELTSSIKLQPFALKNIDKMRALLLANNELETKVKIQNLVTSITHPTDVWGIDSGVDQTGYPYSALVRRTTEEDITWNAFEMNGLVVKTYQSDLFNNWLDNTLVDTIAQRTKIDTTSGGFTPDTLILQEKIYKLLNRILVSGGTYYDWQEATYGEGVARMCEIPMYIGGMSTEIMFEEVINNSASEADGRYQALGSLGGKGMNVNKKGGNNIHVRMDEPGYIMAICSITPRISQSQGNEWDRTELKTMDDLHKPELDGIGFQDLMVEQMCWWNTVLTPGSGNHNVTPYHRDSVGKQTAWINYQTAIDKVYGDFAKQDGYSFMVLSRNYDQEGAFGVSDLTSYIDPSKFNYAFAYQDLAAQNFWVQLNIKCTSRRKMGAQQLPTL